MEIPNRQAAKNAKVGACHSGEEAEILNAAQIWLPVLRSGDRTIIFLAPLASRRFKLFLELESFRGRDTLESLEDLLMQAGIGAAH